MDTNNVPVSSDSPKKKLPRISYNAPVVLTFAIISMVALILDQITDGQVNQLLFSVYRAPADNFFFYFRLFGHSMGHASWAHFSGNMMLFLLLGPILEEKYGSKNLLFMIITTAIVSGLACILFFKNVALLGASGIVFMMIILTSASCIKDKKIPLTMILILIIYLGAEIWDGLFAKDNISQLTHIIGGICGAVFGLVTAKSDKE